MDRSGSRHSVWSPAWLIVLAAASLGACQGLSPQAPRADAASQPPVPSWRVIERVGESRYLSPSMSGWEQVVAGSILPAGSQISTGIGGRLILTQAANQLSAGTSSRFILPGWEPGGSVRQTAGWLRYRVEAAPSGSFGIETPFLALSMDDAVVDVTVADSETEVAVVSGRVHVKTQDDRRQIDLHAGYVGYAGLEGNRLALRRGPGLALEPVPVTVIPALHPGRPGQTTTPAPAAFQGAAGQGGRADQRAAVQGVPANQAAADPSDRPARGAAPGIDVDMPRPDLPAGPLPGRLAAGPPGVAPPPALRGSRAATLLAMAGSTLPAQLGKPALAASLPAADPVMGAATPVAMVLPASTAEAVAAPAAMPVPMDGAGPDRMLDAAPAAAAPAQTARQPAASALRIAEAMPAARPAAQPAAQPAAMPIAESADQVRRRFDLLTEGLLDGLSPAPPAMPGNRR